MKAVLFIIAIICTAVFARTLTSDHYEFLFTRFVEQYDKSYETNDFLNRFSIFRDNLDLILAHNAKKLPWTMGINQFADYTPQEFEAIMGLKRDVVRPAAERAKLLQPVRNIKIADEIDWRPKGVVNPIKNQANCGSCWAFSAVSSLESAIAIKTGNLMDLSEQQVVDCDTSCQGCRGGFTGRANEYIVRVGGVCSTATYPYTGRDESCKANNCEKVGIMTGFKVIDFGDQAHLEALNDMPIGVNIGASSSSFQFYSSGILTECSDRHINHAVNLVGYSNQGRQHYILRNSWGTSWGEEGYMRIATGSDLCGLATDWDDTFPIV